MDQKTSTSSLLVSLAAGVDRDVDADGLSEQIPGLPGEGNSDTTTE